MRTSTVYIHGVTAADITDVRMAPPQHTGPVIVMTGSEHVDGANLFFDSPADFVAWCDRLFELAHAVPEIAAAWSTYPVPS